MANKKNIRKWVDALRSGEFTQGTGALERKEGNRAKNCCLGVACRVAMNNGTDLTVTQYTDTGFLFDNTSSYLPETVQNWLGITEQDPILHNGKSCTTLNDDIKLNFQLIARMIENTYLFPVYDSRL